MSDSPLKIGRPLVASVNWSGRISLSIVFIHIYLHFELLFRSLKSCLYNYGPLHAYKSEEIIFGLPDISFVCFDRVLTWNAFNFSGKLLQILLYNTCFIVNSRTFLLGNSLRPARA